MLAIQRMLFPPDPGALRLYAALRATLAGVLTFFLVLLLGNVIALPVTDRILGFAIALFIAANVRDSTRQQRLITIALAPLFAFVATALAALLFDRPIAGAALLPLIMFMVAYGAQRGPRWASLGIVALIAYFFGLVTHDPPATLPMRLVVLLLAAGAAGLIRCLLLPERPQAELDRLRRAIHAGIVRVLDGIAAAVTAGNWTGPAREELRRTVYRLDDVVMLAQARVAALAAEFPGQASGWLHLLAIELGVERVARIALQDLGTPADRGPLVAILNALRQDAALPSVQFTGVLGGALALLARVMREAPQEGGPAPAAPPPPAGAAPGIRSALQTAVASALAIIAGDLVSPNRWYWAAFAAFVMFQGTRSRGKSLIKGTQFIIGTLAGVFFGMLVATLLSGNASDILRNPQAGSETAPLRAKWGWIVALGVVYMLAGLVALGSVVMATVASVLVVGVMMIIAGVAEVFSAFQIKSWGKFLLWVLLGVLYIVGGFVAFENPLLAAALLTLILGASLVASGIMRIFLAFSMKRESPWIWVLLSGVITLLLGLLILARWPVSSLYILGVFLGIDLVMAGAAWIGLGFGLRRAR